MTTKYMFALYDSSAKIYHAPFLAHHAKEATRFFSVVVNRDGSDVNRFPSDYSLYQVGSFDEFSGQVEGQRHEFVVSAVQLVADDVHIGKKPTLDDLIGVLKSDQVDLEELIDRLKSEDKE